MLARRMTVSVSQDCFCRDVSDDRSGVDVFIDLGAEGSTSSEKSEIILVMRLVDCVDACEGISVGRTGHDSLVVKDMFVDHHANLERKQKERKLSLCNGLLK